MSNVIKSNFIYVTSNEKKVIDNDNIIKRENAIPGAGNAGTDGFANIDYSNDAYKVEAVLKLEAMKEEARKEEVRKSILAETEKSANDILTQAKEKAKQIIDDAMIEAEALKKDNFEEAKNEGYAQGYDLAQRDVEELRQALAIQMQANNEEYENKLCQLETDMIDIITQILENLTGIEIDDKDVILHVIHRTFSGIEHSAEYLIRVSPQDYQIVNDNVSNLYECVREGANIEVVSDDKLDKNQCLIETDSNVIDCSLDEQIRNVCKELKVLSLL